MKKIITGIKPTGAQLHIGNLVGAELPFHRIAEGNDAAIFIADLHALTSVKDGEKLRRQSLELALTYLAVHGPETDITIFKQSDIRAIPKLNWILANVTPLSLMLRAHSFKDAENKRNDFIMKIIEDYIQTTNEEWLSNKLQNEHALAIRGFLEKEYAPAMNMGVFNYPILMAADIIGYDIDVVPVGQDQKQHLEMTRDIARAFNKTYGEEVFTIPQEYIEPNVATLPGIDGRKMSKSYDNFIGVFDDEKTMKKKIMSIVTDSKGVDDVKDPETCNIFALIKVFADPVRTESIRAKYLSGSGYGYGHAKLELLEVLLDFLRPIHEARAQLEQNIDFVEKRLADGALKMNARIDKKMEIVSRLVGV